MRAWAATDERKCLPGCVAGLARLLGCLLGDRRRSPRSLAGPSARSSSRWTSSRSGRSQLERALEQRDGRREIVRAPQRAPACRGKPLAGPLGESRIGLSELGLVAGRPLQVEAEDLVQLDQVFAFLVEPGGQALVQLGSRRLGQGVVGGVSEQQVAEAEGVLSGELGRVGTDQALADERGEARRHRAAVRERLHCAAVEDLTLDRTPLQHGALTVLELIEPRGQERLQGRWDGDLALAFHGHHHHLGDEQRVSAGSVGDLRA